MGNAADVYEKFLEVLQDLVEEAGEVEDDGELGGPAAELGPLADGVVSLLADEYGKDPGEKGIMQHMKLDEVLSYLGERRQGVEVIAASRAAARILAALRWFHYGFFARPDDEEDLDWEEEARCLQAGLDRLLEPLHDGGNSG